MEDQSKKVLAQLSSYEHYSEVFKGLLSGVSDLERKVSIIEPILEALIDTDSESFYIVLGALSNVAYMKASHLSHNWQDHVGANEMEALAERIAKV